MEELQMEVASHDRFFARLVSLVPVDLYTHADSLSGGHIASKTAPKKIVADSESGEEVDDEDDDSEDEEEKKEKYYKHKKQPMTVDEKKAKSKENKKRKYAEENAVTEDLPPLQEEAPKKVNGNFSEEKMESLRQRLQNRIAQMKENRTPKKKTETKVTKPKEPKQKQPEVDMDIDKSMEELKKTLDDHNNYDVEGASDDSDDDDDEVVQSNEILNENGDFEFSHMTRINTNPNAGLTPKASKSKRAGGKVQRLKNLLAEAEKKRQRLKSLVNSKDEILQRKAHAELWNDALASAAGEKPIIVSTTGQISKTELKIKKAIKKHDKKKEKSAQQWTARIQSVEEDKTSRINKREENLANKKNRNLLKDDNANNKTKEGNHASGGKGQPINKPGSNTHFNKQKPNHNNNNNKDHKGGNGGKHHGKGGGGGGNNNRAGFEGKKSDGRFLNSSG